MHSHKTNFALGLAAAVAAFFASAMVLAAAGLIPHGCLLPAEAAPPATTAAAPAAVLPRVRALENRFFFHSYEQDPLEKRLQRLELLVFGQTKDGSDQERLQHLNTTIAERDRESALKMQRQHQAAAAVVPPVNSESGAANKVAPGGTHYPAVTALEWRVLKKTYPSEALDDRLGRLEAKLFGQPSPTMSYADRVDRLNRTLGIGAVASTPRSRYRGPMPKTQPNGGGQPSYDFHAVPFGTNETNPSMPFFGTFGFSDPQMSELFKQMNEQMEEMMRMTVPPGQFFEESPTTPPKKLKPRWKVLPEHSGNSIRQSPAPYNDPNSI